MLLGLLSRYFPSSSSFCNDIEKLSSNPSSLSCSSSMAMAMATPSEILRSRSSSSSGGGGGTGHDVQVTASAFAAAETKGCIESQLKHCYKCNKKFKFKIKRIRCRHSCFKCHNVFCSMCGRTDHSEMLQCKVPSSCVCENCLNGQEAQPFFIRSSSINSAASEDIDNGNSNSNNDSICISAIASSNGNGTDSKRGVSDESSSSSSASQSISFVPNPITRSRSSSWFRCAR